MDATVEMLVKATAALTVWVASGISVIVQDVMFFAGALWSSMGRCWRLHCSLPLETRAAILLLLERYFMSRPCINLYPKCQQFIAKIIDYDEVYSG